VKRAAGMAVRGAPRLSGRNSSRASTAGRAARRNRGLAGGWASAQSDSVPWRSISSMKTRRPCWKAATAIEAAVVLLPEPPFCVTNETTRPEPKDETEFTRTGYVGVFEIADFQRHGDVGFSFRYVKRVANAR
jgi:hypothetical protein